MSLLETVDITLRMRTLTCCAKGCGVTFAVPYWWEHERREDHTWWYCPNGHRQYFPQQTEEERLREELAQKKRALEYAEASAERLRKSMKRVERSLAATKGVVTRTKKRVGKGVCPCCNRHFVNLARHMETKHPAYGDG